MILVPTIQSYSFYISCICHSKYDFPPLCDVLPMYHSFLEILWLLNQLMLHSSKNLLNVNFANLKLYY